MDPRHLAPLAVLLGGTLPFAPATAVVIEGYFDPPSVVQGDSISLHVSTDAPSFDVEVHRVGAVDVLYHELDGLPGVIQPVPADSAWKGVDWPASAAFEVPTPWPSGVYCASLIPEGGGPFSTRFAVFTVVEDQPGSTASILFQNSLSTWQAYNSWGGRSLYEIHGDGERAHHLGFDRPTLLSLGRGMFSYWEMPMIRWLEGQGYALEYCTTRETHADPGLEAAYDLVMVVGQDEYWSREVRNHLDARVAAGRHLAIFGGNTGWWQIRYHDDGRGMTCYKSAALDPLTGVDDDRVTVHWHAPPVNRPTNPLTGASLLHGGNPVGTPEYTVRQPEHWVFDGTGLAQFDVFGGEGSIGVEVDGADLTWQQGRAYPTGLDGTPLTFQILATSSATNGYTTMGILEDAAIVFNAASITWSLGLGQSEAVDAITHNVLAATVQDPWSPRLDELRIARVAWRDTPPLVSVDVRNDSATEVSRFTDLRVAAVPLGVSTASAMDGELQVPPLLPGETRRLSLGMDPAELPPSAAVRIDGRTEDVPGCPADGGWIGSFDVELAEAGNGTELRLCGAEVDLPVCVGGAPSAVALFVEPDEPTAWSFSSLPPGWSARLAVNAGGEPGADAPSILPAGPADYWLEFAADTEILIGEGVGIRWSLEDADGSGVELDLETCTCLDATEARRLEPAGTSLHVGPSPTAGPLRVRFVAPAGTPARVTIHDVAGRRVATLFDGVTRGPTESVGWDGRIPGTVRAAGVYFVRLEAGSELRTRRFVLTR